MERSINEYAGADNRAENVRLSESISLIGELSKKITDKTSPNKQKKDISKGEKLVLQCLINKDGVTQLDIVKFTAFKPPTISIMLKKMENDGLITRRPDEYDLRAMRVFITDKGRAEYCNAVKVVKMIETKLLNGISEEEIDVMVKTLKKIKFNIEQF